MTRNILFSLISIFSLNSQDIEPVEWQYDVNKINDTEYNISFSASILDGWKLYSQFSPDEGALPTSFSFINNTSDFEADELFNEDDYIVGFDNVFKMDLYYYENEANFNQNVKLLDEDLNQIKVEIDYSSCDDELCIFRNETFNVILDNSIIVTESENVTLEDVRRYNALELDLDKSNYNSANFIERSNYFEIFIFGLIAGFLALLTVVVSALTGERGNFVLRACAGMLAGLVWRPKFILYASLIMIQIIAVFTLIYLKPDFANRYGEKFLNNLPIPITIFNNDYKVTTKEDNLIVENQYWGAWRGGIQQGLITPFKGIGPSGTRKTCKNLNTKLPEWLPGKNYCGNHPHNFYIQLFAEIGVIGLIIGSCFFISIITTCYKARNNQLNCPMSSTAFVVPLAFFFPIQQFGSFYGQWGNLFTWFAIGFAIAQYQGWRKVKNYS